MSAMREDLEAWRIGQYVRSDETQTEHDLRCAFHSLRFLRKYHDQIADPWVPCDFTWPAYGERVLVRNSTSSYIGFARLIEGRGVWMSDHGTEFHRVTHWMRIP